MNDVDLFGTEFPFDQRWDKDQNAKLLNIVFHGGTFGNFLKYFLDKFSLLSPDIEKMPFTDTGTSHGKIKYSGLIQRYHLHFINDNKDFTGLPVCIIFPSTERDFLYLKAAQWYRAGDRKNSPDCLWSKKIEDMPTNLKKHSNNIISLYNLGILDSIPKFIVRDWYKLEFHEKLETKYNYRWFKTFKNHPFFKKQKIHYFPLESFFSFNFFIKNIKILNDFFDLQLDFNRIAEMRFVFDSGYNLDQYRQESNLAFDIIDILSTENDIDIPQLDVSVEGFLYAHIEKIVPFIQMPLTNYFFKNTKEIKEYISCYPHHYKAMNPNMPKFNGIDNPFYLYKNKK